MKYIYWLFLSITSILWMEGSAQPGFRTVRKNLNDYTLEEIGLIKKSTKYDKFFFIVDSTTRLDRVQHLNDFKNLNLIINLKKIPEIFEIVKFDSLISLTISSFSAVLEDISGIESFIFLEKLAVSGTSINTLPKNMASMKSLSEIRLYENDRLINLGGIGNLENLKRLSISSSRVLECIDVDLSGTQIEYIGIFSLFRLVNIDGITTCKDLKELRLSGIGIKSFPQKFNRLAKLESLEINDNYRLNDISEIKNLKKLAHISLYRNNSIKSFSNLSSNTQLQRIAIISDSLTNLLGVEKLIKVCSLELYSRSREFLLPKRFHQLKNLEYFSLSAPSMNISMVKQLPKLKSLYLSDLNIDRLPKVIFTNTHLENFSINNSQILDLTSLSNFKKSKKIKWITIRNNEKLVKMPASSTFINLQRFELFYNPILKLSIDYDLDKEKYLWEIKNNGDSLL